MKSQMENVMDSMSGMIFLDDVRDKSLRLNRTVETVSTDDSQDDNELSLNTSGCESSAYLPSPPRITKSYAGESIASAFSPINVEKDSYVKSKPLSVSQTSITGSSSSIDDSSIVESSLSSVPKSEVEVNVNITVVDTDIMGRSTPMARMRLDEVALAAQMDPDPLASPPRKVQIDPQKTMADKHRKWRRQMKEVQRLKDEERRQHRKIEAENNICSLNLLQNAKDQPVHFLEQLTTMRCGTISDVLSGDWSSDSETSSEAETISVASPVPAPKKKNGRRKHDERQAYDKEKVEKVSSRSDESEKKSLLTSPQSSISHFEVQRNNNFIKAFIQEASQDGVSMIWHMPSHGRVKVENPIDIVAFLELGFLQQDGSFAGPRLAWYNESGSALGAIELLDIKSLARASPLQLRDYPFAIPGNSTILKLENSPNALVLEASSSSALKRFVHGIRWVVARLSFNLIVGHQDVCCELLEMADSSAKGYGFEKDKAMNDLTKQLIDKAAVSSRQQLV